MVFSDWSIFSRFNIFFVGHISSMPKKSKILFLKIIALCTLMPICDFQIITRSSWHVSLFGSMVVMIILTLISGIKIDVYKKAFSNKILLINGILQAFIDVFALSVAVVILPVTVVIISALAASSISMIIGAVVWKESKTYSQLIFSSLALLLSIIMIMS